MGNRGSMDPNVRLHVMLPRTRHDQLLIASKRAGVSLGRLIDIGLADLLGRIEREGAVVVPLREPAAGASS
jgi:hypothetical protein